MTAKKWVIIVILFVGLTACDRSLEVRDLPLDGQNQTWIDAPLPNSTLPLQPYKLIFHSASPGGITEFEVHVNSVLIAKVPPASTDSTGTLFYGEYLWTPVAPGTYLIEVRGIGSGGGSSSDQVYVTVIGDDDDEVVTPESTPRLTPVPDPTATPRSTTAPTATNTPVPEVGQIRVHLYIDANSNGNQDRSEVDYPDVKVSLKMCSCRTSCRESHSATTNKDGNALFSNLSYGPYCVSTDSRLTPTTTYPVNVNVNSPALITKNIGYIVD